MNYKYLILALWAFVFAFKLFIQYLDRKTLSFPLKDNVKDIYDDSEYKKWSSYESECLKLSMIRLIINFAFVSLILIFDIIALLPCMSDNRYIQTVAVIAIISFAEQLINLPTSYIGTFVIEEKYGFNKSTRKTFFADEIKEFVLGTALSSILVILFILLYDSIGDWILLVFTGIVTLFMLIMAFLSPLLSKIYNKFVPLEDGELRDKLTALLNKHGFTVKEIKVMDGSKRSTKANAYFSGIGKTKSIVLYDTLLETMDTDEIVGIFAHELAHGKYKHVQKLLVSRIAVIFALIAVLWGLVKLPVCNDFGFDGVNYPMVYFIGMEVLSTFILVTSGIFTSALSRKYEYQADALAAQEGYGEKLISGLKKLHKNSLSNLCPHPLIVKLSYSHPPISERIAAIEKEMKKNIK